jgi:hypothetical protein
MDLANILDLKPLCYSTVSKLVIPPIPSAGMGVVKNELGVSGNLASGGVAAGSNHATTHHTLHHNQMLHPVRTTMVAIVTTRELQRRSTILQYPIREQRNRTKNQHCLVQTQSDRPMEFVSIVFRSVLYSIAFVSPLKLERNGC